MGPKESTGSKQRLHGFKDWFEPSLFADTQRIFFLRYATYFSKYFWLKMFFEAVALVGVVREPRSLAPYPADR